LSVYSHTGEWLPGQNTNHSRESFCTILYEKNGKH
jgi:hypothetical protein